MKLSLPGKLADALNIKGERVKKGRGYTVHFEIPDDEFDVLTDELSEIREPMTLYVAARKVLKKWDVHGAKPVRRKAPPRKATIDERTFNRKTTLGELVEGTEFLQKATGRWGRVMTQGLGSATVVWERYTTRQPLDIETGAPTKGREAWSTKTIVFVRTE